MQNSKDEDFLIYSVLVVENTGPRILNNYWMRRGQCYAPYAPQLRFDRQQ
jgi:hypothetical protein